MVKEKSGVSVDVRPKDGCVVVYDANGKVIGTLRMYHRTWKVSTDAKGN